MIPKQKMGELAAEADDRADPIAYLKEIPPDAHCRVRNRCNVAPARKSTSRYAEVATPVLAIVT